MCLAQCPDDEAELEIWVRYRAALVEDALHRFDGPRAVLFSFVHEQFYR